MNAKINLSIGDKHHNLLKNVESSQLTYKELKHSATFGCNEIGILIEAKSIIENVHFLLVGFLFCILLYYINYYLIYNLIYFYIFKSSIMT